MVGSYTKGCVCKAVYGEDLAYAIVDSRRRNYHNTMQKRMNEKS